MKVRALEEHKNSPSAACNRHQQGVGSGLQAERALTFMTESR